METKLVSMLQIMNKSNSKVDDNGIQRSIPFNLCSHLIMSMPNRWCYWIFIDFHIPAKQVKGNSGEETKLSRSPGDQFSSGQMNKRCDTASHWY